MNLDKLEVQLVKLTKQLVADVCLASTRASKAEQHKVYGKLAGKKKTTKKNGK